MAWPSPVGIEGILAAVELGIHRKGSACIEGILAAVLAQLDDLAGRAAVDELAAVVLVAASSACSPMARASSPPVGVADHGACIESIRAAVGVRAGPPRKNPGPEPGAACIEGIRPAVDTLAAVH